MPTFGSPSRTVCIITMKPTYVQARVSAAPATNRMVELVYIACANSLTMVAFYLAALSSLMSPIIHVDKKDNL